MSRPLGEALEQGRRALSRRDPDGACEAMLPALEHVTVRREEYAALVSALVEAESARGDARAVLTLRWYLEGGGGKLAREALLGQVPPLDRGRTLVAAAEANPRERVRLLQAGAAAFEEAGAITQAAIARERAEDFEGARTLWSRLSQALASTATEHYAAGLARFNLSRTAKRSGNPQAAREAAIGAVHMIQEAADRFETSGERERAFDCFQVLIAIGEETGELEHVLEGYVNAVRILREDQLRYYALESYEQAIKKAAAAREAAAAATLAREMAAYARKEGLDAVANDAALKEAALWRDAAALSTERGAPPEIAENALLAAVLSLGQCGRFTEVGARFRELEALPLDEKRRAHYARVAARYASVADQPLEAAPLPSHLRHETGFPPVWHVDLVEWEQRGSAAEACADVLLDPQRHESLRRRALAARLTALGVEAEARPESDALLALVEQLAHLDLYEMLSPLEHLYRTDHDDVRAAVVRVLSGFFFKRTFATLRDAALSRDRALVDAAAASIRKLSFPHAFDPLARIHRDCEDQKVRLAVVRSLAQIERAEAGEALLGMLLQAPRPEMEAMAQELASSRGGPFVAAARAALPTLASPAKEIVERLFQGWRVS